MQQAKAAKATSGGVGQISGGKEVIKSEKDLPAKFSANNGECFKWCHCCLKMKMHKSATQQCYINNQMLVTQKIAQHKATIKMSIK